MTPDLSRRKLLYGLGVASVASVTGCMGSDDMETDPNGNANPTANEGNGGMGTSGGTAGGSNGSVDLGAGQPTLGDLSTGRVLVAYEDPSCPLCRGFHTGSFQTLRNDVFSKNQAGFVFRGIPIIYPWGNPASHLLEATFAESEQAHWALLDHYFNNQSRYRGKGTDTVQSQTRSFLSNETSVDAGAVISAASSSAIKQAVQTDLDASKELNISATPTLVIYQDGEQVTVFRGSAPASQIKAALGV